MRIGWSVSRDGEDTDVFFGESDEVVDESEDSSVREGLEGIIVVVSCVLDSKKGDESVFELCSVSGRSSVRCHGDVVSVVITGTVNLITCRSVGWSEGILVDEQVFSSSSSI